MKNTKRRVVHCPFCLMHGNEPQLGTIEVYLTDTKTIWICERHYKHINPKRKEGDEPTQNQSEIPTPKIGWHAEYLKASDRAMQLERELAEAKEQATTFLSKWVEVEKERDALRAELAEEKARLDWLEKAARAHRIGCVHGLAPTTKPGWKYTVDDNVEYQTADTLREAIDAARK